MFVILSFCIFIIVRSYALGDVINMKNKKVFWIVYKRIERKQPTWSSKQVATVASKMLKQKNRTNRLEKIE